MSVDLTTRYLGLDLRNPLVVSASPLTAEPSGVGTLERAGAAAVVLPSLFEEQIEHEELAVHHAHEIHAESFAESLDFFPELQHYNTGPRSYLEHIRACKKAVGIPIIASLNGATPGGWSEYARMIEDAGADAIELNVYMVPTDVEMSGHEVEEQHLHLVSAVRKAVSIPLAVKIAPYFTSLPDVARRLAAVGADGLVLFNRDLGPDIDLESFDVVTHMLLSRPEEIRLPLRWVAILKGRVDLSLAATTGIHETEDVIKVLLAGADVAMMASAVLRRGPEHVTRVLSRLQEWLLERAFDSIEQLKGSVSRRKCANPTAYERVNYMKSLASYSRELG